MKLGPSTLVNLLVAALALGTTAVVLITDDEPTTSELEARAKNLLPLFSRAELASISAKSAAGAWTLDAHPATDSSPARYELRGTSPTPADPQAVEDLLRSLELAGFVRRLAAEGDDREVLGLAAPRGELRVKFVREEYTLRFGKEASTPAGTTYLEVAAPGREPALYLVRSDFVRDVLVESDALRPRDVMPFAMAEVASFSWSEGEKSTALTRAQGPSFVDAAGRRARRDSLERLGLALARARSERFVALPAAERGLADDPRALRVRFTARDGRKVEFRVGGRCPAQPELEVLLRSAPFSSAECVAPGVRQVFRDTATSLDDTSPFLLRVDEVESLRLERQGRLLELTRSEKGFRLSAPAAADVELDAGNARLEALIRVNAERIEEPDLAALGLEPAAGTLRLVSSVLEGIPRFEETVQIGRARPDGRLPIRRSSDGVTLLVPADSAWAYAVDSTLLKSRRIFDFGPSDLGKLTIVTSQERQELERRGEGFVLVLPKGHHHDGALVLDLVQALATLQTDRWVADAARPEHGLARPSAVLTLDLGGRQNPPKQHTLTLGAPTTGGVFASLGPESGVFVLPRSFANRATTLLLSRAVFEVDTSTLSSIVFEREGQQRLTLRRRGDELVSDVPRAPAALERLLEALSNLRPEAALHTGPARGDEGFARPTLLVRLLPLDPSRKTKVIRVGRTVTHQNAAMYYARADGTDATYLVPERVVRDLLEELDQ